MVAPIKTIAQILDIAPIAQYLAANDSAEKKLFNNSDIDPMLHRKIYIERKSVEWMYLRNPNDAALRGAANYLYDLLGKYGLLALKVIFGRAQAPPIVTGPSNATVDDGDTANFTIGVVSVLTYTIAWYKNGVLIPGQTGTTLSFTAQLADTGAVYNAVVTNAAGSTSSANATLTVNTTLQGLWWYGDTDYTAELAAGTDNVPWEDGGIFSIVDGQPFTINLPEAAENNKYSAYRYPTSQAPRVSYFNTPLNQGPIPNIVFASNNSFGGFRYTYTRQPASFELTSTPLILS